MKQFEAPIPGQSLTGAPKAMPWERPPEIVDPEQALQHYLARLNGPQQVEDILDMLELEMDVKTLTEGLTRIGVAEGLHSIDVALIISPVIHEYIVSLADEAGIEYDEGLVDKKAEEEKRKTITKAKKEQILNKLRDERKGKKGSKAPTPTDDLKMTVSEAPMESGDEMVAETEAPVAEEIKGLMSRRTK